MRTLAVIALVLLILLLVMPLGMGMAMGHCPQCTIGAGNPLLAYEVMLVSALALAGTGSSRLRATEDRALGRLLTERLDRPPRCS